MDANFFEKLSELEAKALELKNQLDNMTAEIQSLKACAPAEKPVLIEKPAPRPLDEEPLDLSLSPEDLDFEADGAGPVSETLLPEPEPEPEHTPEPIPEPEPEPTPEPIPEPEPEPTPEPEPEPEPEPTPEPTPEPEPEPTPEPKTIFEAGDEVDLEDMETALFGKPLEEQKAPASINQKTTPARSIADAMTGRVTWRTDIPGPEVKSIRSAIGLGDQVVFINKLFRKDGALYQSTIDKLNNTETFAEAMSFLSENFPEWNLESDDVYRFMMAVRRKIRK